MKLTASYHIGQCYGYHGAVISLSDALQSAERMALNNQGKRITVYVHEVTDEGLKLFAKLTLERWTRP